MSDNQVDAMMRGIHDELVRLVPSYWPTAAERVYVEVTDELVQRLARFAYEEGRAVARRYLRPWPEVDERTRRYWEHLVREQLTGGKGE